MSLHTSRRKNPDNHRKVGMISPSEPVIKKLLPATPIKSGDTVEVKVTTNGGWSREEANKLSGQLGKVMYVDDAEEPRFRVDIAGKIFDLATDEVIEVSHEV